jgi:uncharacterized protein YgiM (DUF1202 family)
MRRHLTPLLVAVTALALLLGMIVFPSSPARVAEANPGTNWNASYYNNTDLTGTPVLTRVDGQIDFNWGTGSPDPAVPADNFSVRWTQTVNFPASGQWTFRVGADDGIRMWIDVTQIINEWHGAPNGYTTYTVTLDALTAGPHELKVEYYEATGNAGVQTQWYQGTSGAPAAAAPASATSSTTGANSAASWSAQYFNNTDLSGNPALSRTDGKIDFNWATGSPDGAIQADNFSARWTATVNFPTTGVWTFRVGADDGIRMWVDVTEIINEWHGAANGFATYTTTLNQLTAGDHVLRVEYYESSGPAGALVEWYAGTGSGDTSSAAAAPAAPTAVPIKPIWAAATGYGVNVRTGPSTSYPVVTQIKYPDNYKVVGALGTMRWILIELDNGTTAWVSNDWVYLYSDEPDFVTKIPKVEPEAAASVVTAPEPVQVTVRGRAVNALPVRDAASNRGKVIANVPQNSIMNIEAISRNGGWYLMNWEGLRGWVYSPNVSFVEGWITDLVVSNEIMPAPPAGQIFVPLTESGEPITVRGRAYSNIVLRDAASVRGQDIGSVAGNTEFVIEGRNTNGAWYLINIDGQTGWVSSPYVQIIEGRYEDLQIR